MPFADLVFRPRVALTLCNLVRARLRRSPVELRDEQILRPMRDHLVGDPASYVTFVRAAREELERKAKAS